MRKLRWLAAALIVASSFLFAPAVGAAPGPTPDPTYTALRAARPDGRRIPVQNLVLERDAFRFQLDSGEIHLLKPVDGRTIGGVFVGTGSYRLTPTTPNEMRQLALSSGSGAGFESLSDSFDDLLLLFADETLAELERHAAIQEGTPDPRARRIQEQWIERQRKDFEINFHLRLLRDLLNNPRVKRGALMVLVQGEKYPAALAGVDPEGADALLSFSRLGGEGTVFYVTDPNRGGIWYHGGQPRPGKRLADALDYRVETEIARDTDVKGTTTVRFQPLVQDLRFLPIGLLPELRISEAAYALEAAGAEPAWKPLAFVQEAEKEDAQAAVVFPEPLAKGATVLLRLSYAGDKVLKDGGDKNYFVGARTSWYANLGVFSDPASFELVYRVPVGNEVISVGRKVDEKTEGKQAVTTWKTDAPAQVAGFNYGEFKKLEQSDETSGLMVQVFTNPGTPDIVREINSIMGGGGGEALGFDPETGSVYGTGTPGMGKVNTARLAEASMADGLNSARLFATWFGPLPQKHVAITQQSQWFFGQSWPSLIFMPYISFLDGTQRQRLGLAQANDFVNNVGYHEFAHQWWGHLVGAATYRDQWLEEGFSEFSSAVAVQHVKGWGAYEGFWADARKVILAKYPGEDRPHFEAGPITQGFRLSTQRTPSAASAIIYSKGGYVLHMLRMMMREPAAPNPDQRFIAMMRDFTSTYAGKSATTADFQKVAERHLVAALNATGDGKLDWFFDQWVHGHEIPRYTSELKVEKGEGDQWRITGQVKQQEVGESFRALVPLQVEFGKNEVATVGLLPMKGAMTLPVSVQVKLPKKPRRALVNAHGEVLARE